MGRQAPGAQPVRGTGAAPKRLHLHKNDLPDRIDQAALTYKAKQGHSITVALHGQRAGNRVRNSTAENYPAGQAVATRKLAAGNLLAVLATGAQHLDQSALGGDLETVCGDIGHLAHLADHVGETPEYGLARIENLDFLAVQRRPCSRAQDCSRGSGCKPGRPALPNRFWLPPTGTSLRSSPATRPAPLPGACRPSPDRRPPASPCTPIGNSLLK